MRQDSGGNKSFMEKKWDSEPGLLPNPVAERLKGGLSVPVSGVWGG